MNSDSGRDGSRARRAGALLFGALFCVPLIWAGCGSGAPPEGDIERRTTVDAMFEKISNKYADVPVIDRDGVSAASSVLLVDVRPEAERQVATIPGAMTVGELEAKGDLAGRVVVAYCTVGERSGRYAKKLRAQGIDARNLRAGILGWVYEGGSLVDGNGQPTQKAHVYGDRWNLLPEGWEGITH